MDRTFKIALIGLDTSHTTAFAELMQDPDSKFHVPGLHAIRCLSFETPFQDAEGLRKRAEYLNRIGVEVVYDFEEAVKGCDAIFLEINDPSLHLEYFRKVAGLGKPVFLDKPFADTVAHARDILQIAEENRTRFFTASSLRFAGDFDLAMKDIDPMNQNAAVWGPVGKAPTGSSIVWYGVHAVEILQRAMGHGAESVNAVPTPDGYIATVFYHNERAGVVQLSRSSWDYGALLQDRKNRNKVVSISNEKPFYYFLLLKILDFLQNGNQVVEHSESFEVMAILEAMDNSVNSGKMCDVENISH